MVVSNIDIARDRERDGSGDENNLLTEPSGSPDAGPYMRATEAELLQQVASLQAQLKEMQALRAIDRQRVSALREMLLEAHDQLQLRDSGIMQALGLEPGIPESAKQPAVPSATPEQYVNRDPDTVRELIAFLDMLDAAVEKIYTTRRWKWANPLWSLRRLFSFTSQCRGYWRIDDILSKYKEWQRRHPGIKG